MRCQPNRVAAMTSSNSPAMASVTIWRCATRDVVARKFSGLRLARRIERSHPEAGHSREAPHVLRGHLLIVQDGSGSNRQVDQSHWCSRRIQLSGPGACQPGYGRVKGNDLKHFFSMGGELQAQLTSTQRVRSIDPANKSGESHGVAATLIPAIRTFSHLRSSSRVRSMSAAASALV